MSHMHVKSFSLVFVHTSNITAPLVRAADIATIDPYVDYTKNISDDWQLNDPYNSNTPRVVGRVLDYLHVVIAAGNRRTTARAGSNNSDTPGQVLAVLASLRSVSQLTLYLYPIQTAQACCS